MGTTEEKGRAAAPPATPPVITRTTCRLCGDGRLRTVLSLGDLYVSDFIERGQTGIPAPLELVLCGGCDLLQLRHTAPQEIMYARHYWYRSGINSVIIEDLREIVTVSLGLVRLDRGDVVLDIGANDGTLLGFVPREYVRVGCEPADNLQEELRARCDRVIHEFWSREAYEKLGVRPAKIVTAIGMFYDMEDPNRFIRDAVAVMADDGIFVAQLMCLSPMIRQRDVGNICHEHLEYYSYPTLRTLFEKNGLEVFRVEENGINGGSYRLFCRRYRSGSVGHAEPEFDYDEFARRIEENKRACVEFVKKEVGRGRKVWAYGASTKGNTILQYYGLDHRWIGAAADRSPEKWGKFTVGTMIPILSEEEARRANPDYFLVLPYAFLDAFCEREREWRKGGGKFIVPIPSFRLA